MDIFLTAVQIGNANEGFCANTANIWQIVGYVLLVFKIVIPILLIIWGMLDLGKAVVASKDDEIKKATKGLAMRAVAAVIIFLIPTLISYIMGLIGGFGEVNEDFNVCKKCITSPINNCGEADTIWTGEQ